MRHAVQLRDLIDRSVVDVIKPQAAELYLGQSCSDLQHKGGTELFLLPSMLPLSRFFLLGGIGERGFGKPA